jgi:hypothetical protein
MKRHLFEPQEIRNYKMIAVTESRDEKGKRNGSEGLQFEQREVQRSRKDR